MALHSWIEQGMNAPFGESRNFDQIGIINIPQLQSSNENHSIQFTFNPFPYLPPELIVSILSHTPADSIPSLRKTNNFFQLHVDIYQQQLFKIRCRRYPAEILSAYSTIHNIDFDTIQNTPKAWETLSKFEQKANICLSLENLLSQILRVRDDSVSRRFYRAFLRQWESRRTMFFPKEQWQEALLDRFHIYEDCTRSEICDIVHLQMLYRNILSMALPWHIILPNDGTWNVRIHWSLRSDAFRNIIDQIIGCGPEFILHLLSLPHERVVEVLRVCVGLFVRDARQLRFCCFDDVMAKLLTRLDGGSHAATRWQEEESYFEVCAATNWFCEGDVRVIPFRNRFM
jgi:hypothetical protein